jgi:hypothetical protein
MTLEGSKDGSEAFVLPVVLFAAVRQLSFSGVFLSLSFCIFLPDFLKNILTTGPTTLTLQ